MIFADKLIQLRKKSGWSQEYLAEQMNVSRQSVSKWEGATSVPELAKIVRLSELFGVSTDYLLKDEIEEIEEIEMRSEIHECRLVTIEEASAFMDIKEKTAKPIALGVFLCIISVIPLMLLGGMSEIPKYRITENMAGGIGVMIMLVIVATAVTIFLINGHKTAPYIYLEKEIFEIEYGVEGMVKERKERYRKTYTKCNILGTLLCILSLVPLMSGAVINDENELFLIFMLTLMFVMIGIGVVFFICCGIQWASYEKLLQEGEYSEQNKVKST